MPELGVAVGGAPGPGGVAVAGPPMPGPGGTPASLPSQPEGSAPGFVPPAPGSGRGSSMLWSGAARPRPSSGWMGAGGGGGGGSPIPAPGVTLGSGVATPASVLLSPRVIDSEVSTRNTRSTGRFSSGQVLVMTMVTRAVSPSSIWPGSTDLFNPDTQALAGSAGAGACACRAGEAKVDMASATSVTGAMATARRRFNSIMICPPVSGLAASPDTLAAPSHRMAK
jgi:hypothetical protein